MRKRALAALTVLLVSHGLAFAQQFASSPVGDLETQAETGGVWGQGEYLLWWLKNGRVPPLVTASGDGKLGSPGVRPLVDNLGFADDVRPGGRFALGYNFEAAPDVGVVANYFFLADRRSEVSFSSGGDPALAQPFVDAVTGQPDANRVAVPGFVSGTVSVGARTSLWGAEANLTAGLVRSDNFRLTALGGFRFLRLEDEVTSNEQFLVSPALPQFGGGNRAILQDGFRTDNRFYGGQVGAEAGLRLGLLTLDFRGKLGLGQMQQVVHVNGVTNKVAPDGSRTVFSGGLFALRSNIGRHQRDELAFIPEVGLNAGLLLTPRCTVYAGYSFLWVSTVARAGEQIDPIINVSQFPIREANKPLVGPARPAIPFDGADFWAQGLNFGLELRF